MLHRQHATPRSVDYYRYEHRHDLIEGVGRVDVAPRRAEVRPVEDVEQLRAEFGVARSADGEPLRQRHVEILITRRARNADAAGAPRPGCRARERVDVQKVIERLAGRHRIADAVGPLAAADRLQRRAAYVEHRDRESAAGLEDARDDPAAEHRAGGARAALVASV